MTTGRRGGAHGAARRLVTGLGVVLLFAWAVPAQGQAAWESPVLLGPGTPAGWGFYLVDPHPGSGIGLLTTFRGEDAPVGLGYRLGLAEGRAGKLAVFAGVDMAGGLVEQTADFPVDVIWFTGAGFGVGDTFELSIPLGAGVGRELEVDQVTFHPYVAPRVVLDARITSEDENEGDEDDLSLGFAADLGLDITFEPSWAVRFGATLGDRTALAIGFSVRAF